MSEHIMCTVLQQDAVAMEGKSITFSFGSEHHTYYLSEEAMSKLIREMAKSMYEEMASKIEHLEDVRDAVIKDRNELLSRIDYEMNDHRQQVEEGKADWAVDENP